jgi:hypothetical protein
MKKYIVILSFLLLSCSDKKEVQKITESDNLFTPKNVDKIDSLLISTEGLEIAVEEVVYEKQTLKNDNTKLKKELVLVKDELITVKDCLQVAKEKIKNYKVPKKRTFFDKVLGTNKDSITIIDTIR